jgi:hypothetical protein
MTTLDPAVHHVPSADETSVTCLHCIMKARIVKPAQTAVARQWLSSSRMIAATGTHATIEELLEAGFCMPSVPRCYKQEKSRV